MAWGARGNTSALVSPQHLAQRPDRTLRVVFEVAAEARRHRDVARPGWVPIEVASEARRGSRRRQVLLASREAPALPQPPPHATDSGGSRACRIAGLARL